MKTILTNIATKTVFVFVLLFIGSFPFPHYFIPDVGAFTHSFFETITSWFAKYILQVQQPFTTELISDSTAFYINALWIFCFSVIVATIWQQFDKHNHFKKYYYWFLVFVRYYLAMQLLAYGFNKIFKWQFYLPEPNTLFTTVGNTYKDLLYWNSMGVSRTYSIFTGLLELVAAVLLLFKRTTLLGACLAFGILLNVLFINLSFDISVKLYSLFLLLLIVLLLLPNAKQLYHFFFQVQKQNIESKSRKKYLLLLKWLVILVIVIDAMAVYVQSNNYNDDAAPRPFLHGAYEAQTFVLNNDTLLPLIKDTHYWRRMFIHRRGYFIVQYMNDSMQDFELTIDSTKHSFTILNVADSTTHFFGYTKESDSTLQLTGKFYNDSIKVHFNKIDLKKLPLLQNEFSWTID